MARVDHVMLSEAKHLGTIKRDPSLRSGWHDLADLDGWYS
jgi:hypothetical protein